MLTLFIVGIPLLSLLLITSAITSKLALAEKTKPWTRTQVLSVFVPQLAAILLPFAVIVIFGHAR